MSPTTVPRRQTPSGLTGRHVLTAAIGFFSVVLAVNGFLLFKAVSTHSGLVAQEPYRKGLDYNDRITASDRQRVRGWRESLDVDPTGDVKLVLADAGGHPVSGLLVKGGLGRPATTTQDRAFEFKESAPGTYLAQVGQLAAGNWILQIEAGARSEPSRGSERPDGSVSYRLKRRLWLKP